MDKMLNNDYPKKQESVGAAANEEDVEMEAPAEQAANQALVSENSHAEEQPAADEGEQEPLDVAKE
jgi:hypothetical protein